MDLNAELLKWTKATCLVLMDEHMVHPVHKAKTLSRAGFEEGEIADILGCDVERVRTFIKPRAQTNAEEVTASGEVAHKLA